MRLRARPRQRRGAAPELPVRRPRQRVPAAGLRDEPGPVARRAGGCRDTRHAGRAPAPGGRVMLRGTQTPEALTLAPPLVPPVSFSLPPPVGPDASPVCDTVSLTCAPCAAAS